MEKMVPCYGDLKAEQNITKARSAQVKLYWNLLSEHLILGEFAVSYRCALKQAFEKDINKLQSVFICLTLTIIIIFFLQTNRCGRGMRGWPLSLPGSETQSKKSRILKMVRCEERMHGSTTHVSCGCFLANRLLSY